MKLYLITGFLGAGKTTFLKNFVHQLKGKSLWLIINDFGKISVDGTLLKEVNAVKNEICNGSIFCACRMDQFENALNQAVREKPEIILVEASGLADPTGVEKLLEQPDFTEIEYEGSICLVDTPRLEKVIHTARVLPKQLRVSSLVLLNKADLASRQQLEEAERTIRELNPFAAVVSTEFGAFKAEWMTQIHPIASGEPDRLPDIQLQKKLIHICGPITEQQLRKVLEMLADESWRIKGFVAAEGKHFCVSCVGPSIRITETEEYANENQLVLLAGPGMALRKAVKETIKWYPEMIQEDKNAF